MNLPPTAFELATARQLCLERGRDEPNEQDIQDAIKLACGMNQRRIEMGLNVWE
jgi:hypothetical protein